MPLNNSPIISANISKFHQQEGQRGVNYVKRKLLQPSFLCSQAEERLKELKNAHGRINASLSKVPDGKIHIVNSGGRVQYYLRKSPQEKSGMYLSKSDKQQIRLYLQKSYDEKVLKILEKEIKILEQFVRLFSGLDEALQKVYESYPDKSKQFLQPIDMSDLLYEQIWLNTPYTGKTLPEYSPGFITDNGEHVRSKSELNIANALLKEKIPYKYECPLKVDRFTIIYPDFTILNPRTRKVFYWEHRGMMDDRDYAKHTVKRIKEYQAAGFYLGDSLLLTEETAAIPLGTAEITQIIHHYLL